MHLPCPYFQPTMKYLLFDSSNQILYHCMSKNIPSSSLPSGSIAIIIIIIINPQKVPLNTPLHIQTNTLPAKHRHVPVCSVLLIHNLEQLHEVKASEKEKRTYITSMCIKILVDEHSTQYQDSLQIGSHSDPPKPQVTVTNKVGEIRKSSKPSKISEITMSGTGQLLSSYTLTQFTLQPLSVLFVVTLIRFRLVVTSSHLACSSRQLQSLYISVELTELPLCTWLCP